MPRGPQYTDDELLDEIRRLANEVSRYPPLKRDMNKHGNHSAGACSRDERSPLLALKRRKSAI
ncbi:homing endonuclease associated repeat-containing protein [Natrarchaeobius sp. A-rgal3]|uniref:homing endonuclease associated repeat-containing protein n=1 Tax=Natrarchaeobius versutus TaxID=1679078 RepID=UPI00350F3CF7